MFDLRYHVASLAAVFLALVIGILVGVGLSSGGFIKKSERALLNRQIADLQSRLDSTSKALGDLSRERRTTDVFVKQTYPALMNDRLAGKRVAILFVGSVDPHVRSLVERTLADAGAGDPLRVRAIKVPVDASALDRLLDGRPAFARYAGAEGAADLGRRLAAEFLAGGKAPAWKLLSAQLVEERSGDDKPSADAIVVVRSASPQRGPTARLLAGLYAGLHAGRIPAVGVETSGEAESAIEAFRKADLASVDDVDALGGRLALALLLGGAKPGSYGIKQTAKDGILPPVEPAPAPAGS